MIATACARKAQRIDPRKVRILDRKGRPRWNEMWDGNPRIARMEEEGDFQELRNGSGARPYLDHEKTTPERFIFREDYESEPGEIYLSASEKTLASQTAGAIVIEPNVKARASPNKQWGLANWQHLAKSLRDLPLVQLGPPGTWMAGRHVRHVVTLSPRDAAGALSGARAAILHEGYLHHAAAALGIPAVVIRGGFIGPKVTGYPGQVDFFDGEGLGCGMRTNCAHCRAAMNAILPETVAQSLRALL